MAEAVAPIPVEKRHILSIVIPVYNAEASIGRLCERLIELYQSTWRLQIVLVNDCSRDRTDAVCKDLHARHPDLLCYIRLSRNFGEHNAVMAGLTYAKGEWCVIMDDDFQNPPEEVASLLEKAGEGGNDVIYAEYANKRDSRFRNWGSRLNDKMAGIVLNKPPGLYLSSFKVINRFLIDEVLRYTGPDPYIDGIILRTTSAIGTVPIHHAARAQGSSGYTFKKLMTLWGNMVVAFSIYPIRLIGIFGLIIMVMGGFMMLQNVYVSYFAKEGVTVSEVDELRSLLVFLRGVTLLLTGIMGEYVGRMYMKFNNAPQYVVRERLPAQNLS